MMITKPKTYAATLSEWTDWDIASHKLACLLGIIDESKGSFTIDFKWIYSCNNKTGNTLSDVLTSLVELGFLEFDAENDRVRYNTVFDVNRVDEN